MGTGTKLDIKDNAFDVVLIINVMHHIDSGDHLDFLKEVYRVLQPEGKFFVYEHNPLHPLVYLRFYYLSEVDKGAHMINPFKIKQHLKATGFQQIKDTLFTIRSLWRVLLFRYKGVKRVC